MLRRVAVGLVLSLQLLVLFFPLMQRFALWARQRGDAQLHALAVRAQGWLLRRVLPTPRFRGTLVEPRLYVGSLEDAHSVCDLQDRRIRSVLTAAAEPTGLQPIPLPSEDFSVLQIDIGCTDSLGPGLRHSLPFLHDALQRAGGRSVLVQSYGGNGRACAVAAAFLMQARGVTLETALNQIQSVRPSALASPTSEAVWIPQLREFESELRERGLLSSPSSRLAD